MTKAVEITQSTVDGLLSKFELREDGFYYRDMSSQPKRKTLSFRKAGSVSNGYRVIWLNGRLHREHRVIYYIHHGIAPAVIDHINRNKLDNRISNLRAATKAENSVNTPIRKNNTSGITGVSWDKAKRLWRSHVKVDGKQLFLGRFRDVAEAAKAVEIARKSYFG